MSERSDTERLDWLEHVSTPPNMLVPNVFSSDWLCGWQEDQPLREAIDMMMAAMAAMAAEEAPNDE